MEALRSAEALQVHWEAAHSSNGGGASATPTKTKPPTYVILEFNVKNTLTTCTTPLHVNVCNKCACVLVCDTHNYQGSPHRSGGPPQPTKYEPPPPDPDEDELDHYKTQVKIMTDLINVRTSIFSTQYNVRRITSTQLLIMVDLVIRPLNSTHLCMHHTEVHCNLVAKN